jgi:hypothetical protein
MNSVYSYLIKWINTQLEILNDESLELDNKLKSMLEAFVDEETDHLQLLEELKDYLTIDEINILVYGILVCVNISMFELLEKGYYAFIQHVVIYTLQNEVFENDAKHRYFAHMVQKYHWVPGSVSTSSPAPIAARELRNTFDYMQQNEIKASYIDDPHRITVGDSIYFGDPKNPTPAHVETNVLSGKWNYFEQKQIFSMWHEDHTRVPRTIKTKLAQLNFSSEFISVQSSGYQLDLTKFLAGTMIRCDDDAPVLNPAMERPGYTQVICYTLIVKGEEGKGEPKIYRIDFLR